MAEMRRCWHCGEPLEWATITGDDLRSMVGIDSLEDPMQATLREIPQDAWDRAAAVLRESLPRTASCWRQRAWTTARRSPSTPAPTRSSRAGCRPTKSAPPSRRARQSGCTSPLPQARSRRWRSAPTIRSGRKLFQPTTPACRWCRLLPPRCSSLVGFGTRRAISPLTASGPALSPGERLLDGSRRPGACKRQPHQPRLTCSPICGIVNSPQSRWNRPQASRPRRESDEPHERYLHGHPSKRR